MNEYAIGLDYGTNSCRAVLMQVGSTEELFSSMYEYPSGQQGVLISKQDPHLARQNPADYIDGMAFNIKALTQYAEQEISGFSAEQIIGLTCATTGSTLIPVDQDFHHRHHPEPARPQNQSRPYLGNFQGSEKRGRHRRDPCRGR